MAYASQSARLLNDLIFGPDGRDPDQLQLDVEDLDTVVDSQDAQSSPRYGGRQSAYVDVFETATNTVFIHEQHLLSPEELEFLRVYGTISYAARFLLVKLALRKQNSWLSLQKLKYESELGPEGVVKAIDELCRPLYFVKEEVKMEDKDESEDSKIKIGEREVDYIDLTLDSDDEDMKPELSPPEAGPSSSATSSNSINVLDAGDLDLSYICQSESLMSLSELLDSLSREQLKTLAKDMKTNSHSSTKPALIYALLASAQNQSTISDFVIAVPSPRVKARGKIRIKAEPEPSGWRQPTLGKFFSDKRPTKRHSQEARLREMALQLTGKCVKLNYDVYKLLRRIHIIFLRSTELPTSIFLEALLNRFKKRVHADYPYGRSPDIWRTREELLAYERALEVKAKIDEILSGGESGRGRGSKTPVVVAHGFVTPVTPGTSKSHAKCEHQDDDEGEVEEMEVQVKETAVIQAARGVVQEWEENVYSIWKDLVAAGVNQTDERKPERERFEPGHVYTRIAEKAYSSYGKLKQFPQELKLLDELLAQNLWRRGKRGKWYDRRALILTNYIVNLEDDRTLVLHSAMQGLKDGLMDFDTGGVYRPNLFKRLQAVEKKLKVPEEERTTWAAGLRKATEVNVIATRVWTRADSIKLDVHGNPIKGKENKRATTPMKSEEAKAYFTPMSEKVKGKRRAVDVDGPLVGGGPTNHAQIDGKWSWKGKSIWRGLDGGEVNVETRALQHYELQGYKGFHSETSIYRTLFGLLFWDIIFTPVPGAFETQFQAGPLDLGEDSFYYARKNLIDRRLEEIREGRGGNILERYDDMYRDKGTCCVGVRWDICDKSDLLEIVDCLGGETLAGICKLFCEDYVGRCGGGPDLIVWNMTTRTCKSVEVKGPGDTLQENQKAWVDALLCAGATVELCHVVDQYASTKTPRGKGKGRFKTPKTVPSKKSFKAHHGSGCGADTDDEVEWQEDDQVPLDVDDEFRLPEMVGATKSKPHHNVRLRGLKRLHSLDPDELPVLSQQSAPISITLPRSQSSSGWPTVDRAEVVIFSPKKRKPNK